MKKRFKKAMAILCAIAMVVTSITVYNTNAANAADYSGLTWVEIGTSGVYAASLEDFGIDYTYVDGTVGAVVPKVAAGTYPIWPAFTNATLNGGTTGFSVDGAGIRITLADLPDNAYSVFEATSAVKDYQFHIILKKGTPVEGETTTVDPEAPTTTTAAPTTTKQQPPVMKANPLVKLNNFGQGDVVYVAGLDTITNALTYNLYVDGTLWGAVTNGQNIPVSEFTPGSHLFQTTGVNSAGESTKSEGYTLVIPGEVVETTTVAPTTAVPYVEGAVLVNDSNVDKEVPAYTAGDYWQAEYNNAPVNYVNGKQYVAEVVVTSSVDKAIKMVFQRVNIWDFVDGAKGYEVNLKAGEKVKITYVFTANNDCDNGNFDIYLGSVAEAATLNFESKKLTTYTTAPEGTATGVEVLTPAPVSTYSVDVDGTKTDVAKDGTFTLPTTNTLGYYDGTDAYEAGAEVTVTKDMTFKSIDVSVSTEQGAGLRYIGSAGLRFQSTVSSTVAGLVEDTDTVSEGTLITAYDLYTEKGNGSLDLTSNYTVRNVANSGWYNDTVGTYCGSLTGIVESNYIRNFVAKGYATITYVGGTTKTVYAGVSGVKSIKGIAQAVIDHSYAGIADEYKSVIDAFAAAK